MKDPSEVFLIFVLVFITKKKLYENPSEKKKEHVHQIQVNEIEKSNKNPLILAH